MLRYISKGEVKLHKIVIMDDQKVHALLTRETIENYCREKKISIAIKVVTNVEALWQYLKVESNINLIFLDIVLQEGMNGIQVARRLNLELEGIPIVYLTGYLQYATEVYETNHCYYVLKEELPERLPLIFKKIQQDKKYEKLVANVGGKLIVMEQRRVMYAERNLRITRLVLVKDEILIINDSIKNLIKACNPMTFVRCHNSLIVNLDYVSVYNRTNLMMKNGTSVSISRKYIKTVRDQFEEWVKQI